MNLPEDSLSMYDKNTKIRNKVPRISTIEGHPIYLTFPLRRKFIISGCKYTKLKEYWKSILLKLKEKYKEIKITSCEKHSGDEEKFQIILQSEEEEANIYEKAVQNVFHFLNGTTIRITEFLSQAVFWHKPMKQMLFEIIENLGLVCELYQRAKPVPKINIIGPEDSVKKAVENWDGEIFVEDNIHKGSIFKMYLRKVN